VTKAFAVKNTGTAASNTKNNKATAAIIGLLLDAIVIIIADCCLIVCFLFLFTYLLIPSGQKTKERLSFFLLF